MMGKGRTLGVSLLPALQWILIQCAVVLGFPPVTSGIGSILSLLGVDTGGFYGFLEKNGSYCIYILMDVIVLIPAVLWFRRFPVRGEKKEGRFFGISFRGILLLLLTGLCLQLISNLFLTLVFGIFPELMESYSQVLENLGMIFRGLTLRILEGAFPFWAANILQALYFGIIHGNLVQGGYAFLAGMVLGYLVKRNGTLAAGILCHFGVNLSGVLLGLL